MTDQQRLEQLRLAYQNLLMGKSARVIQKDGRRVEYSPADKQSLLNEKGGLIQWINRNYLNLVLSLSSEFPSL